jgi:hypothetical protein
MTKGEMIKGRLVQGESAKHQVKWNMVINPSKETLFLKERQRHSNDD